MAKKSLSQPLIALIIALNIFNLIIILGKIKKSAYLQESIQILKDYFLGFHLIPLASFLLILFFFSLFKKITFSIFMSRVILLFFLFFIALNLALLPEIIENFSGQERFEFQRKGPSLKEAVLRSPAKQARIIETYFELNTYLSNKTLVVPLSNPLEKDYYFQVFISPVRVIKKDYIHKISDEDYQALMVHPHYLFRTPKNILRIDSYLIVKPELFSEGAVLLEYDKNIIFAPSNLTNLPALDNHD